MKPLTKNMWRAIKKPLGRFIAIVLIIMLGVLIFVGVKASGPSLNDSLSKTLLNTKLSDIQVLSTTGFDKKDIKIAEKLSDAKAEAVKFKYVLAGKDKSAVALFGYQSQQKQNKLILRSGRLPKSKNEIVLDNRAKTKYGYKLGQTFTFLKSANLKQRKYKIVGFADSPMYIDNTERGTTNIGDGTVHFFAYIPDNQMNLDSATLLNIRFDSLQKYSSFGNHYQDQINKKIIQLKKLFKTRSKIRSSQILNKTLSVIEGKQKQLNQAKNEVDQAKKQLVEKSGGLVKTTPKLDQQEKRLNVQQKKLSGLLKKANQNSKTVYTWQTREDLPGFSTYGDSSNRISAIANVFPAFFFLIAALITFTTITRMIEEARGQIGIFKALGYSKFSIARNYIGYALMAGMAGTIIGALIGNNFLPRIVLSLYKNYIPIVAVVKFQWGFFALSILFSLIATTGAAIIVVFNELSEKPAALMQPKSPKSAKKILLEKIKPLWSSLNFKQKISYRNLFRYKSRMFMTIIGIAGGTALILTGFGIQNSIAASGTRQFNELTKYQALIRLKSAKSENRVLGTLQKNKRYKSHVDISSDIGKIQANGKQVSDTGIYVPKENSRFYQYVNLRRVNSNQKITLPKKGVVITQKIAAVLNINVGDKIRITTSSGIKAQAEVKAIAENFVGNFMYMSQSSYTKLFSHKANWNSFLIRLKTQTEKQRNKLSNQLIEKDDVLGVTYSEDQKNTVSNMSSSLIPIILILILLSGILSFAVLYNLTNINISERIRELSTVKVLGFYDKEVTMYVVRENIVLTIIGIFTGYIVGNLLTWYILQQAETDQVIFPLTIHLFGYIASTFLMILFTVIVMFITHQRLKNIDMVSALKSNE
ncbi:ABC transporter permease [Oenococcus oeni]|uniref:ABC transporter permease n=1 Tax=Oenococcus oeni TaxID=1247 RepID=UPI003EE445FD